jgi:hypothetical protein
MGFKVITFENNSSFEDLVSIPLTTIKNTKFFHIHKKLQSSPFVK